MVEPRIGAGAFLNPSHAWLATGFVRSQRRRRIGFTLQTCGERPGVLDCHRCPLREERQHGVAGISQQRGVAIAPFWQRLAAIKRPAVHRLSRLNDPRDRGVPAFEILQRLLFRAGRGPGFIARCLVFHDADKVREASPAQQIGHRMLARSGPDTCRGRRGVLSECGHGRSRAPSDAAGKVRLVRPQHLRPHGRVNSIGANQQVRLDRFTAIEIGDHLPAPIFVPFEAMAQHEGVRRPGRKFGPQRLDQVSSVDVDVFCAPAVHRCFAERNGKDGPAAATPAHLRGLRAEGVRHHPGANAQGIQDLHGIGAELQAGTDLADDTGLFGNRDGVATLFQRERSGQSANSTADDKNMHGQPAPCSGRISDPGRGRLCRRSGRNGGRNICTRRNPRRPFHTRRAGGQGHRRRHYRIPCGF